MNARRVALMPLLVVLAVPLLGLLDIGRVEALLWVALLAAWFVAFFVWAREPRRSTVSS